MFQCVTLEGWGFVMLATMKTTSPFTFLYFVTLTFLGAFFMVNLTLAVINNKFTEAHNFYEEERRMVDMKRRRGINGLTFQ